MDKIFEMDLLNNAIEIGESIIDKAIIDSNGIHWKNVKSLSTADDLETDINETIATGVSGIVLFYIELYKASHSEIYLEYINSSANWLISHCQKIPATHGFYFGRMGTVFTLLKIAEITKKEYYHQKAIEISLQFKIISDVPVKNYNLYNGLAGTILGLLHLHIETNEKWILDSIYEGIQHLIKNTKSNGVGFYWDNSFVESKSVSTKPLCSMPLGSSGIGLLFLYLSKYFDNKDYEHISVNALNYEDQYYNKDINNWPDFRINFDNKILERLRKSYLKGKLSDFEPEDYCANWMFGIVGQSFPRLCANDIINGKYRNSIIHTIESNFKVSNIGNKLSNYTLANGKGGLGLLLLSLSHSQKNDEFFENALAIAKMGIDERATKSFYQFGFNAGIEYEDDSLFMGNAGIGYFYLKLYNKSSDCILFPTLNSTSNVNNDHWLYRFSLNYIIDKIAKAWYPNTFNIIEDKLLLKISDLNLESLNSSLSFHIEQTLESLKDPKANDAYNYDKFKLSIQQLIADNHSHSGFCLTSEVSKNRSLLESNLREDLMMKTLKLNQYSYFFISKWDWKNASSNNSGKIYTLYSFGEEYTLSESQYLILESFKTLQNVNSVYKIFITVNMSNTMDYDFLLHSFTDTIKFFMSKGVLVCEKKPVIKYLFLNPKDLKSHSEASLNNSNPIS